MSQRNARLFNRVDIGLLECSIVSTLDSSSLPFPNKFPNKLTKPLGLKMSSTIVGNMLSGRPESQEETFSHEDGITLPSVRGELSLEVIEPASGSGTPETISEDLPSCKTLGVKAPVCTSSSMRRWSRRLARRLMLPFASTRGVFASTRGVMLIDVALPGCSCNAVCVLLIHSRTLDLACRASSRSIWPVAELSQLTERSTSTTSMCSNLVKISDITIFPESHVVPHDFS